MSIGFLPNKESIRGARVNPVHYDSLGELARSQANQAETSIHYPSGSLFLYEGNVLPISCNAIGGANKAWLVNHALMEGAPNECCNRMELFAPISMTDDLKDTWQCHRLLGLQEFQVPRPASESK